MSGRPANILRPIKLTTYLPEDLRAKLDLHLFSSLEGRVPHGAYAKFIAERVKEFFETSRTPKEISESVEAAGDLQYTLALHGLLSEIAMTDLRTGWSESKIVDVVRRAREITGKVPR